jgi:hypothetical protein
MILVAAAIGALTGGFAEQAGLSVVTIAILSGLAATIVAVIVRNELINRVSSAGPDDFRIPIVVAVYTIIASLAGSLAGKEILDDMGGTPSGIWVGTVAGIVSAILMAIIMITYYMTPRSRGQ